MQAKPDIRKRLMPLLLATVGLATALYLGWLVNTRVGGGDVYAPYSSLRTDPRGCKALFLAIDALPDWRAVRNLRPWHRCDLPDDAVLLVPAGAESVTELPRREKEALLAWLERGHRVIFTATARPSWQRDADDRRKDKEDKEEEEPPPPAATTPVQHRLLDMPGLFGLAFDYPDGESPPANIASVRFPGGVLRGNCRLVLPEDASWSVEGAVDGRPVIAGRKIGKGELLVVADSTFLSNEALWRDRRSGFVLALLGGPATIVFDERMLGTVESPGVMTLVRRLGLHGMVMGGLLLLVLLIWQGMCPLVPADDRRDHGIDEQGRLAGRDAVDGLVALLHRGLPPSRLLSDGIARWSHTRESGPAPSAGELAKADEIARAASPGKLASHYRQLQSLLLRKPNHIPPNHGLH